MSNHITALLITQSGQSLAEMHIFKHSYKYVFSGVLILINECGLLEWDTTILYNFIKTAAVNIKISSWKFLLLFIV